MVDSYGAGRAFGQRLGKLIEDEIHEFDSIEAALAYLQSWGE